MTLLQSITYSEEGGDFNYTSQTRILSRQKVTTPWHQSSSSEKMYVGLFAGLKHLPKARYVLERELGKWSN